MARQLKKTYPPITKASKKQHTEMVRDIFATIPEGYDLLNRILSLRRDVAWRRFAVHRMKFFKTSRLLDLATGTADLAMEAAIAYPAINVVALDFVQEMIVRGQRKIEKQGLSKRIRLLQADALALPVADGAFDVASIAFGIRNIPERLKTLKEMTRVVAPGGQVMVLEMHLPGNKYVRKVYRSYLNHFLPRIAGYFTKNPAAYSYLSDSITHFPRPAVFAGLMGEAGLQKIEQFPLTLGTTYLHIGYKAR
ncbi:MAG: ubiquinone/menaquinone biosynthesis methyltransferase [Syntrophales bacterium]